MTWNNIMTRFRKTLNYFLTLRKPTSILEVESCLQLYQTVLLYSVLVVYKQPTSVRVTMNNHTNISIKIITTRTLRI